jgi:hypothetical protein
MLMVRAGWVWLHSTGSLICGTNKTMSPKLLQPKKRGRGRPPSGLGTPIQVRLKRDQLALLDAWIAKQPSPKPSRPAAIRSILSEALARRAKRKPTTL